MTETPSTTTSAGFRRLVAASVFINLFVFALSVTITPAAVNEILPQLCHNSYALFGWIYPVWMLGFFFCVLLGGRYSDKLGKLPVLFAGCSLMAIGCFVFGIARSYPVVLTGSLLIGAGGGCSEANSMALLADVFGKRRQTSVMNFAQVFFAAGAVAGPTAVSRLLAADLDWRWAYLATAFLCVVGLFLCLAGASKREERTRAHEQSASWKPLLRDKLVLVLALGILLYVGAETGAGTWMAAYFKHELRTSGPLAASTVALLWMGIGLGRVAAVWSSRHFSDYALISGSLALAAISQAVLLLLNSPIAAMVAVLVLGFALGPVWPTIVSRAGAAHPQQSGAVLALVVSTGGIGSAIIPPTIGQAAGSVGLRYAIWICFLLLAINFAIFVRLWMRNRARSAAP